MSLSKIHANEETSSAGNMQMKEQNLKKKRSESNLSKQCQRSDKGIVIQSTTCKQKNSCIPRITKCNWRSPITPPFVPVKLLHQNLSKPGEKPDLAFLQQELEAMKLKLEKEGHIISPDMRATLQVNIQVLLNKVNSKLGSSSS